MVVGRTLELQRGDELKKYVLQWLGVLYAVSFLASVVMIWVAFLTLEGGTTDRRTLIVLAVMNIFFFTPGLILAIYKLDFHGYSEFTYTNYQMEFTSPPNFLRPRKIICRVSYADITRIFLDFNCSYILILRNHDRFEIPLKVISSHRNEMMFLESMRLLYQFHVPQYGSRIFFDAPSHLFTNNIEAKAMRGKPGRVFFALQ
jgi:hypothetical protein